MTDAEIAEQIRRVARLHIEAESLEARVIVAAEGLRRVAAMAVQLNETVASWAELMGVAVARAEAPDVVERLIAAIRQTTAKPANDEGIH